MLGLLYILTNVFRRSQNNSKNQSNNSIDYYSTEEDQLNQDGYTHNHQRGIKDSTNHYGYDTRGNPQNSNGYSHEYGYDGNTKENEYNYQSQSQKKGGQYNAEKKIGFYNFTKAYQTEAIIEAPDEGDY